MQLDAFIRWQRSDACCAAKWEQIGPRLLMAPPVNLDPPTPTLQRDIKTGNILLTASGDVQVGGGGGGGGAGACLCC